MKRNIKVVFLLVIFLLVGCAMNYNKSLSGGDKDLIQPTITNFNPKSGKVKIGSSFTFNVDFSEYINYKSALKSLEIYPKEIKYIPKWDEKNLVLEFNDLPLNTTVVVVLNRNLTDLRDNKLDKNYFYSFSTGNKIDSAEFKGKITNSVVLNKFILNKKKNLKVNLYNLLDYKLLSTENLLDSLNLSAYSYQTTANDSGFFNFKYLNKRKYLALAFTDVNNNNIPDYNDDEYVSFSDGIDLENHQFAYKEFTPSLLDVITPYITDVKVLEKNLIEVYFSEKVNLKYMPTPSINSNIDSTYKSKTVYAKKMQSVDKIRLYLKDSLKNDNSYTLIFPEIIDITGNEQEVTENKYFKFYTQEIPIPKKFEIDKKIKKFINIDDSLIIEHNKFYFDSLQVSLWSDKIDSLVADFDNLKIENPFNLQLKFPKYLKAQKYRLLIKKSLTDTIYFNYLNLREASGLGTISGEVAFAKNHSKYCLLAYKLSNKETVVFNNNTKQFSYNISPGKYFISAFLDKDKNNFLSVFPNNKIESENIVCLLDTIVVKKNWETHGLKLNLINK